MTADQPRDPVIAALRYDFPKTYTEPEATAWVAALDALAALSTATSEPPLDVAGPMDEDATPGEALRYILGDIVPFTLERAKQDYWDDIAAWVVAAALRESQPAPADPTEPDPNRTGMPKCPCGDIAYRPDPIAGRQQAWRCGGCHRTLGRCTCTPADPTADLRRLLDEAARGLHRRSFSDSRHRFYGGPGPDGEATYPLHPYETCPHPKCVEVRAALGTTEDGA